MTRVQSKWKGTVEDGLSFNVPVDYVTFKYVPGEYKLLFKIFVGLAYNTRTAWKAKKAEAEAKRKNRKAVASPPAPAAPVKVELAARPTRAHRRLGA